MSSEKTFISCERTSNLSRKLMAFLYFLDIEIQINQIVIEDELFYG
jgi:hypothetical protein